MDNQVSWPFQASESGEIESHLSVRNLLIDFGSRFSESPEHSDGTLSDTFEQPTRSFAVPWTRPPVLLLFLPLFLTVCEPIRADLIFDARTDFVPGLPVSGVNGVWSYGYLGGTNGFTLFEGYTSNSNGYGWWRIPNELGTPGIYRYTASGITPGVNAGDLVLHPGSKLDDEFAVLRFTTPTDGLYDLSLAWRAGDGGVVDVRVFRNSVELFNDLGDNDGGSFSSSAVLLAASETIDLRIGRYGDFYNDSTPVEMTITAVPEPSAVSLLGGGFTSLIFRRRRPPQVTLRS